MRHAEMGSRNRRSWPDHARIDAGTRRVSAAMRRVCAFGRIEPPFPAPFHNLSFSESLDRRKRSAAMPLAAGPAGSSSRCHRCVISRSTGREWRAINGNERDPCTWLIPKGEG